MPPRVNILLIGGGGREHAIAWKLRQSKRLGDLWTTHPENPGIASLAKAMDAPFSTKELYRTEQFCRHNDVHLVIVGPEEPLARGVTDALAVDGRLVFGPSKEATQLESDKAWAKKLMRAAMIPTAEARMFRDVESAKIYVQSRAESSVPPPSVASPFAPPRAPAPAKGAFEGLVVKASGLAKGKGVIVCDSPAEALAAIDRIMVQREFGEAGDEVIIEERLEGPEVSIFALCDGRNLVILDAAQDHKRLQEGDRGPNTGGMGAFCPSPLVDGPLMSLVQSKILVPIVDAMRRDEIEFRGLLYAGLMLTPAGPKVLEFNVRFGDPECQALLPRLKGDLLELLWCTAGGTLADAPDASYDPRHSCCIVLAAPGYPDDPKAGLKIVGIENAQALPDVLVFHAGTKRTSDGTIVTAGGRILNVVGLGDTLAQARERAVAACEKIHFDGMLWRRDIGAAALMPAAPASRTGARAPSRPSA